MDAPPRGRVARGDVAALVRQLNLCADDALRILERVPEDYLKRRDALALASAVSYLACRLKGLSLRIKRLPGNRRYVARYYRELVRMLEIRPPAESAPALARHIAQRLRLPEEVAEKAAALAERGRTLGLNRWTLAAAAVYIAASAAGRRVAVRDIALTANVTETAVRNAVKRLL